MVVNGTHDKLVEGHRTRHRLSKHSQHQSQNPSSRNLILNCFLPACTCFDLTHSDTNRPPNRWAKGPSCLLLSRLPPCLSCAAQRPSCTREQMQPRASNPVSKHAPSAITQPTVICSLRNSKSSSHVIRLAFAVDSFDDSSSTASGSEYESMTLAPSQR
jgi:hypothetical protein